ncbi:Anaphase-promoting complex subunit 3 protein [Oryctes borbonicus]|uniref:Protein unc-45 homolog B n=1 Tax=Oryctes borbonicus TaxID=1629725 RepID=A0A0T6B3M6_9SCAR|nr:Anaphase-promoting complex subunit 3 protein [Oryctes borbonicus]
MVIIDLEEANTYKEKGNKAYQSGDFNDAVTFYQKAINVSPNDNKDISVYYKNLAAVYLKLEKLEEAVEACNKSLEFLPNDPKALYRRLQALEKLGRYEEAYRDARQILNDDPNSKLIQPILERLHKIVQERAKQNAQLSTKVDSMTKIAFDIAADKEKREAAMNNVMVLARENAGSDLIIKAGVVQQLRKLVKIEKNKEILISAVRILGELCKHNPEKTLQVLKVVGVPWFLEILDTNCEQEVNAAQYCIQTVLNMFSGMENKPDGKPNTDMCKKYHNEINTLLTYLVTAVNNRMISGLARDAIVELLMKNIHYNALNWAEQLVEIGGIERLMECASELEEYKYESAMNITPSTRTVVAVCLARIYENMYYDAARDKFIQRVEAFIKGKLLTPDIESKVRATVAITSLLRGPIDVGNTIIAKEGIMEMILVMANTEDELQQKVACECIIAAASKMDKAKAIISQGLGILKNLYKSSSDAVRVRALVGLCKLGSSGGTDAALKPFQEGSNLKLAEACRKFLLHPGKSQDLRKWAAEGLSYLTLDAEVKEKLIDDKAALQSLIELAKTGDQSVLYGVITTLVNLVNAYEKQEVLPEMVELAKFAKHHIPEEHELDDHDFVTKRIQILAKEGVTTALVALSKTESNNSKELISRVFNAICSDQELRGIVVQQGGVKVLIKMALNGTDKGKRHAAQALSRIAITINPEVAFPGQRALEVIRPLLALLHPDCTGLENFEALMGLCNIAQMNESARLRILKEEGFAKIEHYIYEDHLMLCRAATQCVTNMCFSPEIVKIYECPNDKIKMLLALCTDEDLETCLAASGALAILTSTSEICCAKIYEMKSWLEAIHNLLVNANRDIQCRGVNIVRNIISSTKENAEKLMETDVLEILMALLKIEEDNKQDIKMVAAEALKSAEKYGIIRPPNAEDLEEQASTSKIVELED